MDRIDLARQSYKAELARLREKATWAVADVRRALDLVEERLNSGSDQVAGDARRAAEMAVALAQAATALQAVSQLSPAIGTTGA